MTTSCYVLSESMFESITIPETADIVNKEEIDGVLYIEITDSSLTESELSNIEKQITPIWRQ